MKANSTSYKWRKSARTAVLAIAMMLILGAGVWLRWRHALSGSFPPTDLTGWIPYGFGGAFGIVILAVVLHSIHETRTTRRVINAALQGRPPLTDEEFGRRFYEPELAPVAARLRRLLAENLDCELAGLMPSDDFEQWLNLFPGPDCASDSFFEDLAIEFQLPRDCPWPAQFGSFDALVRFVSQNACACRPH